MSRLTMTVVAGLLAGLACMTYAETNRNNITDPKLLAPAPVSQGQFAALLCNYLKRANNEAEYQELKNAPATMVFTPQDVVAAVEYLSEIGMSPYGGWQPSEMLRRHHITSLIVRACGAEDELEIGDQDACLRFVEVQGCDVSTIARAIDCIWKQKRSSNKGVQAIGDESPQPDP